MGTSFDDDALVSRVCCSRVALLILPMSPPASPSPPPDANAPSPPPVPGILITKYTNPIPSRDAAMLYAFSVLVFSLTFTFWAYTIFKDRQHRKKMKKLATTEAIITGNIHDYDMLRIPPMREDALRLGGSGSSPQDGQSSQSDLESHPTAMGRKSKSGIR